MAGFILYSGPSEIDGKPIIMVGIKNSSNVKTGKMLQTFIMRSDIHPCEASKAGEDFSVCGNCPQRAINGGGCYVLLFTAPNAIFKAYKNGKYSTKWNKDTFKKMTIRVGSYGDPSAVPASVWSELLNDNKHTGYTHFWKNEKNDHLKKICMASVQSAKEKLEANNMGWRTFRIISNISEIEKNEMLCLNATKNITCEKCGLCKGAGSAKNIAVIAHGKGKKKVFVNADK